MATETVQKYKISFVFDKSATKLQNLQSKMAKVNKMQEVSLRRQRSITKASQTALADMLRKEEKAAINIARSRKAAADAQFKGRIGALTGQGPGQRASQTAFADMLRKEEALAKVTQKRARSLEQARKSIRRSAFLQDEARTAAEASAKAAVREALSKAKTADELRDAVARQKALVRGAKRFTAEQKKQSFLMSKMSSSSKQIAGNMIGAFALIAGVTGIVRVGQNIQSVESTLEAVSGSSEAAAKNFKFVRDESFRLGTSLVSTAKAYAKLLSSIGSQATVKEGEELLTSLLEASTVLGLSSDDTAGAVRALQQMFGKTKVTAEELRLQLGERLAPAVELMAAAAQKAGLIGKDVKKGQLVSEMEKLMKAGRLTTKVIPFFSKELSKFVGPGLGKALKSNRVAMNRLIFSIQEGANEFFKSGFGQGLTDAFNKLGEGVRDLLPLWKGLGSVVGLVLKGITATVGETFPLLTAMGNSIENITNAVEKLANKFTFLQTVLDGIKKTIQLIMKLVLAPFILVTGLIEEASIALSGGKQKGLFINRDEPILSGIPGQVEGIIRDALSFAFNPFGGGTPPSPAALQEDKSVTITVPVILDGQVLTETVVNSSDFVNATDSRIFHNQ